MIVLKHGTMTQQILEDTAYLSVFGALLKESLMWLMERLISAFNAMRTCQVLCSNIMLEEIDEIQELW